MSGKQDFGSLVQFQTVRVLEYCEVGKMDFRLNGEPDSDSAIHLPAPLKLQLYFCVMHHFHTVLSL